MVDLDRPDPTTVASIQLHGPAFDLVISPDDRFIYAVHEVDDFISVSTPTCGRRRLGRFQLSTLPMD